MTVREPWFPNQREVVTAPIERLLIAVARPDAWDDSPERKVAWDEIKRRIAGKSTLLSTNSQKGPDA